MCQDENENYDKNQSFGWSEFVFELMRDEPIDPLMNCSEDACLNHSSRALSRTNENFRLRVRFSFRLGTRRAH